MVGLAWLVVVGVNFIVVVIVFVLFLVVMIMLAAVIGVVVGLGIFVGIVLVVIVAGGIGCVFMVVVLWDFRPVAGRGMGARLWGFVLVGVVNFPNLYFCHCWCCFCSWSDKGCSCGGCC